MTARDLVLIMGVIEACLAWYEKYIAKNHKEALWRLGIAILFILASMR